MINMTVADLIEKLKNANQNCELTFECCDAHDLTLLDVLIGEKEVRFVIE